MKVETKQEAIDRVKDNNPDDYARLYSFAEIWVQNRFKAFTSEDLKQAYYDAKNPKPRQVNIFGAVINSLAKANLITVSGTATAKLPAAHGRLIRTWISTAYRLKQQTNSLAPQKDQLNIFNQSA